MEDCGIGDVDHEFGGHCFASYLARLLCSRYQKNYIAL